MTIREECKDRDWGADWGGGSASEDPAAVHALLPGHTVNSTVVTDD